MLSQVFDGQWVDMLTSADLWNHSLHLAQTFDDSLGSTVGDAFDNFIKSGQVWALGIGFILGYIVRSFTAY